MGSKYTRVKTAKEIEAMRESGRMLSSVLDAVEPAVVAGASTKALAQKAASELKALGGEAAFLGYQGFPDVLCVSVNDEVVHGIPKSTTILQDGDLVSLDFGVRYRGMITDSARSLFVGRPKSKRVEQLLATTKKSLLSGIDVVRDGVHTGDIAYAVQGVLDKASLGIVRDLVGHGVGHELHEDPNIPNYGNRGGGPILRRGMTIAIEPMATLGNYHVYLDSDHWTVKTRDGSWAAHFEHTVLITESGAEILTA